jgi:cyanophycinase-like exopeptidase
MARVHRHAMKLLGEPIRAVFVDTPAGFQLNNDLIAAKAVEYFRTRLNADLTVASYRSSEAATDADVQAAVEALYQANYVFAGPGSPTYAIQNWRGTPIYDAMQRVLAKGGCLTFASAAALTVGRLAIPVYEIYKVGGAVEWFEGLNLLRHAGLDVCVVPHWDNRSGEDHDTTRCFIGEARWRLLETQIPPSTVVLGIDEHTACILRLDAQIAEVHGRGRVHVQRGSQEQSFAEGVSFSLDILRAETDVETQHFALPSLETTSPEQIHQVVYRLLEMLREARERQDWSMVQAAEDALREVLLGLIAAMPPPIDSQAIATPYVDLLVEVRGELRAAGQWRLADRIRDGLATLGIAVEDGLAGSTWRPASAS